MKKLPLKDNLDHLMRFCSKFLNDTDSFFIRLNGVDSDGNTPESECILNRLGFPFWPLELSMLVSMSLENVRFWYTLSADMKSFVMFVAFVVAADPGIDFIIVFIFVVVRFCSFLCSCFIEWPFKLDVF